MLRLLLAMVAIGVAYLFHVTYCYLTSPGGLLTVSLVLGAIVLSAMLLAGLAYAALLLALNGVMRVSEWQKRRDLTRYEAEQRVRMREIPPQVPVVEPTTVKTAAVPTPQELRPLATTVRDLLGADGRQGRRR